MTGVAIEIEGNNLNLIIDFYDEAGQRIYDSLVSAIIDAIVELKNLVITGFLSGQVLKMVSGKLASSLEVDIDEGLDDITGRVIQQYNIAPYGPVHEHGGTFEIPEHLRRTRNGGVAIVRAHRATYPQRSFMGAALDKLSGQVKDRLLRAVTEALK